MKKTFTTAALICASLFAKAQTWEKVCAAPSGASRIEVSNNGDVFVIGTQLTSGNVYYKKPTDSQFSILPGNGIATDITAHDGLVYAVGGQNSIYAYKNGAWTLFSPLGQLTDIDFDGKTIQGANATLTTINNIYYFTIGVSSNWTAVSGYFTKMTRASDGTLVGKDKLSGSYIYKNNAYQLINNALPITSLSGGTIKNIWATSGSSIYQYDDATTTWTLKNGINGTSFKEVSVNMDKELWALATDGFVYKASLETVLGNPITIGTAVKGETPLDYAYNFGETLINTTKTITFSLTGMTASSTGTVATEGDNFNASITNACGNFALNPAFTLVTKTVSDESNIITVTYTPKPNSYNVPVVRLICGPEKPKPICSNQQVCDPVNETGLGEKAANVKLSYNGRIYTINIRGTAVTELTELNDVQINSKNLFYPNPATNVINVNGFAEIMDLQGNKIISGTDVISINELERGMYLVKTSNGILKLIKE